MKRFVLGLLVLFAVTGCAPAFLADLNKPAGLTGHMTMVGTVGAVNIDTSETNLRFYPTKPIGASIGDVNIQSGFLVSDKGNTEFLRFAYSTGSGAASTSGSQPMPNSLAGTDPNYPYYEYDVVTTTSTANLVVLNVATSQYWYFAVPLPNGSLPNTLTAQVLSYPPDGVQMMPQAGAAEIFNVFDYQASYYTNAVDTMSSTTGAFTNVTNLSFLNLSLGPEGSSAGAFVRVMYFMNLAQTIGYWSYPYNGEWSCYQFTTGSSTAQTLPGVANRIDAVLTTGDLLSTQDGTLRLYDSTGSQQFSKPLNGLQFCYEEYIGSTPYVFFSLPLSLQHNDWAFNVYAIPTSSMRDLGK
ncbi:MAG: hypothetical protein ACLQCB_09025 [Spirochaetia bacterium]